MSEYSPRTSKASSAISALNDSPKVTEKRLVQMGIYNRLLLNIL